MMIIFHVFRKVWMTNDFTIAYRLVRDCSDVSPVNYSDSDPFWNENIAAILLHYCRNMTLLPKISDAESCNIAKHSGNIFCNKSAFVLAITSVNNSFWPQFVAATLSFWQHLIARSRSMLSGNFLGHFVFNFGGNFFKQRKCFSWKSAVINHKIALPL